jgi:hypothetical protein
MAQERGKTWTKLEGCQLEEPQKGLMTIRLRNETSQSRNWVRDKRIVRRPPKLEFDGSRFPFSDLCVCV